jgi:uncharacterized protein (TIGR03435 family)
MAPGSTSLDIGDDHWSARGFDLKSLIAQIDNIDPRQIVLPTSSGPPPRYDLSLTLPEPVSEEAVQHLLLDALRHQFHLTITLGHRTADVYVLSALPTPSRSLQAHRSAPASNSLLKQAALEEPSDPADDPQQITFVGKDCSGVGAKGIEATAASIAELRRTLEPDLDRLLIDETGLNGSYDFRIGGYTNQQELFQHLRADLGLAVTPAQRSIAVLEVHTN